MVLSISSYIDLFALFFSLDYYSFLNTITRIHALICTLPLERCLNKLASQRCTTSEWLSGLCVCFSCGRSWIRAPAGSWTKDYIKDHHKMVQTASLIDTQALEKKFSQATQLCIRPLVCETVFGDMHYRYLLGSIIRVGYCIPGPDFHSVLHGLGHQKKYTYRLIN